MKCNICKRLLVNLYIHNKELKSKKPIGKICVKCGIVEAPTPYFQKQKHDLQKKEDKEKQVKGFRDTPTFILIERKCPYCNFSKHKPKTRKFKAQRVEYENSDGSKNSQLNNPYIRYTCRKCNRAWTKGLPMPFPIPYHLR